MSVVKSKSSAGPTGKLAKAAKAAKAKSKSPVTAQARAKTAKVTKPIAMPVAPPAPAKPAGLAVIANRSALLEALELAAKVTSARSPKPILSCVRLSSADGGLLVESTDLEISLRHLVKQVQIESAGVVLVECVQLVELVKRSPSDTLHLVAKNDYKPADGNDLVGLGESVLMVTDEDSSRIIPTPYAAEDFPLNSKAAELHTRGVAAQVHDIVLPAGSLLKLIDRTSFAVARESTRYAFSGLCVVTNHKNLKLVGTDGRRLVYATLPAEILDSAKRQQPRKILSARAAKVVAAACKILGDNESVLIGLPADPPPDPAADAQGKTPKPQRQAPEPQSPARPYFTFADASGVVHLAATELEGTFPPFEEIIPKDSTHRLEIDTKQFAQCVRKVGLASSETRPGIRLDCTKKGVGMSAISSERGLGDSRYPTRYTGDELAIGFNVEFLAQGLEFVPSESAVLEFTSPTRPGFLHGVNGAEDFGYVIVPVNLG